MFISRALRTLLLRNPTKAHYKFILKDWTRLPDIDHLARVLGTQWFSQQLEPVVMDRPRATQMLVLAPHPDDDILGPGGTLVRSRRAGVSVHIVYMTSAANPTFTDAARSQVTAHAATIEREAIAAASRLGATVEFWRYDKRAVPVDEAAARLRDAIRTVRPQVCVFPFLTDDHPDHRTAAALLAHAYGVDVPPPHFEVWAYQVYGTVLANVVVDVTDTMDEKIALLGHFASQAQHRDWAHYIRGMNAMQSRFLRTRDSRYAELFFVLPVAEYLALCRIYLHPSPIRR